MKAQRSEVGAHATPSRQLDYIEVLIQICICAILPVTKVLTPCQQSVLLRPTAAAFVLTVSRGVTLIAPPVGVLSSFVTR